MKGADEFNNSYHLFEMLYHSGIALIAGIMKDLNKVSTQGFSFSRMVINGAVSGFVGVITFLFLDWLGLDSRLCAAFTGIAGWLGVNLMDFFGLLFKKFIAKKFEVPVTVDEEAKHSELLNK